MYYTSNLEFICVIGLGHTGHGVRVEVKGADCGVDALPALHGLW